MMKKLLGCLIIVISLMAYKVRPTKEVKIDPHWVKKDLPHGWIIYTPAHFQVKTMQGIDSQPGYIYSEKDSIRLQFDIGHEMNARNDSDCDFQARFKQVSESIKSKLIKDLYKVPAENYAFIDTIDHKIATRIKPNKPGKGISSIHIYDCVSNFYIGISAENVPGNKEALVNKIFSTIKRADSN